MADLLALADAGDGGALARPAPRLHGGARPPAPARRDRDPLRVDRPRRGPRLQRRRGGDLRHRERRCSDPATTRSSPGRRTRASTRSPAPTGAEVTLHELRAENGWAIDLDELRAQVTPAHEAHRRSTSPTTRRAPCPDAGDLPGGRRHRRRRRRHAARRRGVPLPRARPGARPPAGRCRRRAARRERGRDVASRSRWPACGSAGSRPTTPASWTAAARFKDYTTICASAPAEILSLIALRARDDVLARSRRIVDANLALLDAFFARRAGAGRLGPSARRPGRLPRAHGRGSRRPLRPGPARGRGRADRARARSSATPATTSASGFGRTDLPAALAGLERVRGPHARPGGADRWPSGSTSSTRPARTSRRR